MTGRRFGRLVVLSSTDKRKSTGAIVWACQCDCGKTCETSSILLNAGQTRSCGCLFVETATAKGRAKRTHGMSDTKTYNSWVGAKGRCQNKDNPKYPQYGGRGIQMHEVWANSFEAFLADMGPRPVGTTLDRYPNLNGNYEPGNCRWATDVEQQNNRRDNRFIEHNGERATVSEYCRTHNLNSRKVQQRLSRGMSAADAIKP